ncbi:MAG: hypothetical protein HOK33_02070 [Rhodobiaceae bacterium]|jgi:hypothetical protein|nr:hypothetical protein [Rhodobiaceae bacterium]MBT5517708.1 hypothetical protein [Rhodobiaceae bacterium]MBT7279165.1 hypothetical protein [Rhodobiaceae bacterium]MDG2495254.1 hypothetical protein [Alphaproteobacteria bacterium]
MIRLLNISLGVLLIMCIAALYHIRYSAEAEARALRHVEREINLEKDRQRTLRAEWSSLNDPRRLQLLSRHYLQLDYLRLSQVEDMRGDETQTIPVLLVPQNTKTGGVYEPR